MGASHHQEQGGGLEKEGEHLSRPGGGGGTGDRTHLSPDPVGSIPSMTQGTPVCTTAPPTPPWPVPPTASQQHPARELGPKAWALGPGSNQSPPRGGDLRQAIGHPCSSSLQTLVLGSALSVPPPLPPLPPGSAPRVLSGSGSWSGPALRLPSVCPSVCPSTTSSRL